MTKRIAAFLTEAWSAYIQSFERIGQSIETVPGWRHIEQSLDDLAWGVSLAIGLFWLLRWWFALIAIALIITT